MTVITDVFEPLARAEKAAFGAPDHPVLLVEHPIGTVKPEEVKRRAEATFERLVEILLQPAQDKAAIGG